MFLEKTILKALAIYLNATITFSNLCSLLVAAENAFNTSRNNLACGFSDTPKCLEPNFTKKIDVLHYVLTTQ